MDGPQYFAYTYTHDSDTAFTALAEGDMNANGVFSEFSMTGAVLEDDSGETVLSLSPSITELNPDE
jgi:hypothetical protein